MPHVSKKEHAAYERQRRKTHPALYVKMHRRKQLKKYGLTEKAFETMLIGQGYACAVCRQISDRQYHVDHNHKTGEVRALLCQKCNMALGLLNEDTKIMQNLIAYVEQHDGRH